jgi:putative membrane protein (TIGR04086 family)
MKNIRWGLVLAGAFLTELAIVIVAIPVTLLSGQESLVYIAPPASFVAAFASALWVARKVSRPVLHGVLVGIVAILIFVGMTLGGPETMAYIIAHALKVAGGALGGFVALKRATANTVSGAPSAQSSS